MATRLAPALAALALLAASAPAWACSVCGCGDPLVAVGEVASNAGQVGLELDGQYLSQKAGGDVPGTTDVLDQYSLLLTASYSPVARLNLVLTVPIVNKVMQNQSGGSSTTTSDLTGLGDVQLGIRWFFWDSVSFSSRTRQSLSLNAVTAVPTGPNGATVNGIRVDQHGQLGTGGWGPSVGLIYRLQGDAWSGFAGAWGLYRTVNSYSYRFGEAALWTAAAQYQPASWFAAALGVDGRWAAADADSGSSVPNTGGLVLTATPAVHFNAFKGGWLFAKAQVPFATRLDGIQTIGPVVTAGLRYEVP